MSKVYNKKLNSNSKINKDGFVIVPSIFAKDNNLTIIEKFILGIIASYAQNERGHCYASNEHLCNEYNFQLRSLQRALKSLQDKGYLKRDIVKKKSNKWITERQLTVIYPSQESDTESCCEGDNMSCCEGDYMAHRYIKSNNKVDNNIYISDNQKEANKEGRYNNYFIELNKDIETDNRYISLHRRPLKKYPDIWLNNKELENVISECKSNDVLPKKVLDKVDIWITNKMLEGLNISTLNVVGALTGWALEACINGDKIKKQAELTNQRFNKIGE